MSLCLYATSYVHGLKIYNSQVPGQRKLELKKTNKFFKSKVESHRTLMAVKPVKINPNPNP